MILSMANLKPLLLLSALAMSAGAQSQVQSLPSRETLARLSTQQLVDMAADLQAALQIEDFRKALSISVQMTTAISSKAVPPTPSASSVQEEISQMESTLTRVGPAGSPLVRTAIAVRALRVGDLAKAKAQAEAAIADVGRVRYPEGSTLVPETLHVCHTVLGLVAVRSGDLASAKQALLNAAHVSPETRAFPGPGGPEFSLAQVLLEQGASQAVSDYLTLVRVWWPDGERQLAEWTAAIRGGGLHYSRRADVDSRDWEPHQ